MTMLLSGDIATFTTSVFGDQLATAFEDPSRINWWLVAGAVVLFAVMIVVVRRWFAREQAQGKAEKAAEPAKAEADA